MDSSSDGRRGLPQKKKPTHFKDDLFTERCINYPSTNPFIHPPRPPDLDLSQVGGSRKMHRYPDDLDVIEFCPETDSSQNCKGRNSGRSQYSADSKIKWSRSNIVATMERFEPKTPKTPKASGSSSSSSSVSSYNQPSQQSNQSNHHHHHHQDYSYAYYEPGAAMRHLNVPAPETPQPTPSTSRHRDASGVSLSSIKTLLSRGNKKNQLNNGAGSSRHTYTTRYGTQENIYEEVGGDGRIRMMSMGEQIISLDQSMVEEEFRRVQNSHRRVLGELNLSVEAMIMPSTPPDENSGDEADDPQNNSDNLADILKSVERGDELLSPVTSTHVVIGSGNGGDLDSGFSGSSSGASYAGIGSLRYHKTGAYPVRSSTPNGGGGDSLYGGSSRSSQRSHEDPGILSSFSTRSSSMYCSSSRCNPRAAEDPGPTTTQTNTKTIKTSFWKGWKKFPVFSSTPTVNKAGTTNVLRLGRRLPSP